MTWARSQGASSKPVTRPGPISESFAVVVASCSDDFGVGRALRLDTSLLSLAIFDFSVLAKGSLRDC